MLQQPSKHHKYVSSSEYRTESSPGSNNNTTNSFLSDPDVLPSPQDPSSSRSTHSAAAVDSGAPESVVLVVRYDRYLRGGG